MYKNLEKLRQSWGHYDVPKFATEEEVVAFEQRTGLLIPDDLRAYFKTLNGNWWDAYLVEFYSLKQFITVKDEVGDRPRFEGIINTLSEHENCFVFADHSIKIFIYAIRLSKVKTDVNEIYIIYSDEEYKLVANSFDEYIGKYVNGIDNYI